MRKTSLVTHRMDLWRAGLLTLVCILAWCTLYHRWTAADWQTPVLYVPGADRGNGVQSAGDAPLMLAWMKAASDGHISPFHYMDVPELGAPFTAHWDDFPLPEKPLFCLAGLLTKMCGLFAAANLTVMLGFILAAVAFYTAGRLLGCAWPWAFAGALVFAFSRFAFARGLPHITILYFWPLPFWLVVCAWMLDGRGIRFGDRRFLFALAVAAVTGVHNVYFLNLFLQFVLFCGLWRAWREGWRAGLPAVAILAAAVAAFLTVNLGSLVFRLVHGPNAAAVQRLYQGLEMFGLKLVDLVVPPPDHRWPLFAWWGDRHLHEIVLPPGELPPSAYLGLVGLGATLWLLAVSLRRLADNVRPPLEAFMILWVILYGGIGGINGIIGTFGLCLFRATTRYSIFILCAVLMFAARRLSALTPERKWLAPAAACVCVGLAWWDQTPPIVSANDLAYTARVVASDRRLVEQMEQALPANAMVFQLPIMPFPESPAKGVGPYEHFRPYFFAHGLRFSFGAVKGRPQQEWQQTLGHGQLQAAVIELESYGFAALLINRNGFADHASPVLEALRQMGRDETIESADGDLVSVTLKPSGQPVLPGAAGAVTPP